MRGALRLVRGESGGQAATPVGFADAGNPGVYAEVASYAAALQSQIDS